MIKQSLMHTNPYLKKRASLRKMLLINIASSTAIELGSNPAWLNTTLKKSRPKSNGSKASS